MLHFSALLRAVLELMVPAECPENQAPRYTIFHGDITETQTRKQWWRCSCVSAVMNVWRCIVVLFVHTQGDRGFDGLPGLPGEKGHRVSNECWDVTTCVCHKHVTKMCNLWHITDYFLICSLKQIPYLLRYFLTHYCESVMKIMISS